MAVVLSSVASVQDLVSGLVFSLLLSVDVSITLKAEVFMETNLFTVFQAVKSECASLWGLSTGPIEQGIAESSLAVVKR